MYSLRQLVTGLQQPSVAKSEMTKRYHQFRSHLPHDIGVQGSYQTGNIGDQAIGRTISKQLSAMGQRTRTFGMDIEGSNAPNHILGGGGVLQDWNGTNHLSKRLNFISEGGAAIGVGVPGFQTSRGRELVRDGLSDVGLITVRDDWSRRRLEPYYEGPIQVTACPTLIREDPGELTTERTGVNFRNWYYLDENIMTEYFGYESSLDLVEAREQYLENIERLCNQVKNPIYIPFHKRDENFARKNLDIDILPYEFSDKKTLRRVSAVEKMICMRYHSLVFAIICNKPLLPIAYEPKVSELAERVDVSSYLPHKHIPAEFEYPDNILELKKSSMENFELLSDYCSF
ncbi:polysaccharide pyruvyl transferase family protein [Halococcus hamelinensis]|nr:polysaccharide pyruvyl transferase family protein [Halococcus hamelinensis]